jgi:outer membrane protein
MKNIILGLLVIAFQVGLAQQMAYIESEKIVDKMPAYQKATQEIEEQIKVWETEVEQKFQAVEQLYQDYVKSESAMSDEVKNQKQQEIFDQERLAKDYREAKFGNDGELQQLQDSKLKPLMDMVMNAAQKVAQENNYDYVFDKMPESNWVWTNPEHDITDKVIAELGL